MANLQLLIDKSQQEEERILAEQELIQSIQDLEAIQTNLLEYIHSQKEGIDSIADNITLSSCHIKKGESDLKIAERLQLKYLPIILGSGIGFAMFGPVGLIPGFKIGGIATGATASVLGGVLGYKYQ